MYGIGTLKEKIEIGRYNIKCPVLGCEKTVSRKRRGDKLKQNDITCSVHKIEIRSSTFIYPKKEDNLLWADDDDLKLLNKVEKFKRESRMENDNSEDAVTWNIFRFLERTTHLPDFVNMITGETVNEVDIVYWSYSVKEDKKWGLLDEAQKIFGEREGRGSEPDMAIVTDKSIIFIEAKFNSGNATKPSNPAESIDRYSKGGNNWSKKVFSEPLEKVAMKRKRYELMRFWLMGSWIAEKEEKDFYLINLVRKANTEKLEDTFKPAIKELKGGPIRMVKRVNWEEIYDLLEERNINDERLKHYFHNKISGFSASGKMKSAFKV